MGIKSGVHGLKDKKVQELIHRNDTHFDLIISEQFFQESWLMFSRKYNAPVITIGNNCVCVFNCYAGSCNNFQFYVQERMDTQTFSIQQWVYKQCGPSFHI